VEQIKSVDFTFIFIILFVDVRTPSRKGARGSVFG
jgi:hypothetical protein